jgi:uncharacterized protein (DUF4415 family)
MSLERRNDMKQEAKRMGRPKGETPPMVSTSMRLPISLIEGFKKKYPQNWQAGMREVLINFIKKEK